MIDEARNLRQLRAWLASGATSFFSRADILKDHDEYWRTLLAGNGPRRPKPKRRFRWFSGTPDLLKDAHKPLFYDPLKSLVEPSHVTLT